MADLGEFDQDYPAAMEASAKFEENLCAVFNESFAEAVATMSAIGEIIQNARPQTVEEWEEAYNALLADYRKLYQAAENVEATALSPGICAPTSKEEDGSARLIVATRTLDELHEVLYD